MGMFDYKNYSSEEAFQLVYDTNKLSNYTVAYNFFDFIPGAAGLNLLGSLTGELFAHDLNVSIPDGWKELKPVDFGLSNDILDHAGYFQIPSLYTGTFLPGPQAKIFGQYNDAGELVRLNFNSAGTNSLVDALDYLNLNSREGVELYEPILEMVRDYAIKNGLESSDVVFSGFSLGAAITNVIAAERLNLADGYFENSDFIAHAVPTIYEDSDVVLNLGFENDVVHRITGNEPNFISVIKALDPGFVNPDKNFDSSSDNFVLYNDVYASKLWDISPFSFLNAPFGWYAHVNAVTTDAYERVYNSDFYNDTRLDSTIIVSDLSALNRGRTWVEDDAAPTSSHYGSAAFLIGTQYDDLIAGGSNYDYIDAGNGNDTIRAGIGIDHVDGSTGQDEIRVEGRSRDWDIYKMSDDTLFFVDKDGINLVEADNVESVSFQKEMFSHYSNYDITSNGLQDSRFFMKWFGRGKKSFLDHEEGTSGDDNLSGQTVFAREGDDSVEGTYSNDTLHGGRGDDVLNGMQGNDQIYGAEGDDRLEGGAGNDWLIGGIGNDTFVIGENAGSDTIVDFNNDIGYNDVIEFSADLFTNLSDLASKATQVVSNVFISFNGSESLTVVNATVDDVLSASVII